MPYELCSRNEFNDKSIHKRSPDLAPLLKLAVQSVTAENIENSLALAEAVKEWTTCFVEVVDDNGDLIPNVVYAGQSGSGKHQFIDVTSKQFVELESVGGKLRFLIGEFTNNRKLAPKPIYAMDPKGKLVDSFRHQQLEGKSVYYILSK